MISNEFSLKEFSNKVDTKQSISKLTDLLESKIQSELHSVLDSKLKEIIDELNSLGHNLTLYYPSKPGDIAYRDESTGKCLLRVSSDCVISVGFSDTVD